MSDAPAQPRLHSGHVRKPTARQLNVLEIFAQCATYEEVSHRLGISPNTVKSHVSGLYHRLQVHTRPEAIAVAIRRGWL